MHFKFLPWFALLGLLALFAARTSAQPAPAPAPAPGTQIEGTIKARRVTGVVQYREMANQEWKTVTENLELKQKTIVKTGENSSVVLVFSNGASINLAHTSTLNIDEFTQDPFNSALAVGDAETEPSNSRTNLTLTHGELVGNVKKLKDANSQFRVGTPVGAAGIRGTTFRIVYRPTGTGQAFNFIMTTLEGNVEVVVGTGTVNTPPVVVTDSQQVIVANVEVNTVTNQLVVTAPTGQTSVIQTPPVVQAAPATVVQQVQASAQQIATAVAAVVFNPPAPVTTPTTTTTQQTTPQPTPEQSTPTPTPTTPAPTQNTPAQNPTPTPPAQNPPTPTPNQSASPGVTPTTPRITNPGGTP